MELPRGGERQRKTKPQDSRWITKAELAETRFFQGTRINDAGIGEASLLLGKDDDGNWIGSADDRHAITVAGSRSGKSSTCLKPNLLLWPSSVLCIDPKGELATMSAAHRAAMGHDVAILDPFGEVKGEAARYRVGFNPLDELRNSSDADMVDDAALVAEALIVADQRGEQHWTLSAKNLLRGLVLFALLQSTRTGSPASLPLIRDLVSLPSSDDENSGGGMTLGGLFHQMQKTGDELGGVVRRSGSTMSGKPKGERGSILSTAIEQTSFLDSLPMREHLTASGGLQTLRQLKRKPTTIYLVLPASRMATHGRWLRLIVSLALGALEREPMKLPAPVLFVLEEFPQLGYMRQIEAAAGLVAGYGVKLWTIIQDLPQLKTLYRDSWETFLGNAGVVQAFGNTDPTTTEFLSRSLGTLQITEKSADPITPTDMTRNMRQGSDSTRTVPLLAPFEVELWGERSLMTSIVKMAGKPPAYLHRATHQEVSSLAR